MRTLTLSLAAALMLAGCADTTEIDNKPAATVEPATPAAMKEKAPEAPAAAKVADPEDAEIPADGDTWNADKDASSIGFLGAKVTATHAGGFSDWKGNAVTQDGKLTFVKFVVDMNSLWAEEKEPAEGSPAYKLTGHLKSPDFFNVEKNPNAAFASTSIEAGEGNQVTVKGNLKMAGQVNAVSFPATVEMTDGKLTAKSDFKINRKDWGIVYKGKPDDLIKDDVALNLDLTFTK